MRTLKLKSCFTILMMYVVCISGRAFTVFAQGMEETAGPGTAVVQNLSDAVSQDTMPVNDAADKGIVLNFKEASLDAVLEYLSEVAGLAVVRETAVEGRITLMSRQPLSTGEAVSLLNVALKERGYAAITMGRILKIVPLADAKKLSIPVRSGNDPDAMESTDSIVTQIIPINHLNVTQLKQDIAPLLPAYAELAANVSSNSLILTDTESNIRRITEIVRALDTTVAAVSEIRVFPLTYADASNTAKLINEMFKSEQTSQQNSQQRGFSQARFFPGGPQQQQESSTTSTSESQHTVKVTASADDRTNTVVVSAPPDIMKVIEGIIKELDSNSVEEEAVFVYDLKNADAANLETVLNELFKTGTTTANSTATTNQQRVFQRMTAQTSATSSSTDQSSGSLAGQVYVVADEDTNSLMVMTASKNFTRVREIIAALDRAVPQVLINVLIAEVTHDKDSDLGAEFSILNLENTELSGSFDVASEITSGIGIKYLNDDVSVTLAALKRVGKLDILSRPYILCSDNQEAEITVGQHVPFITASRTTDTGQTINTIEYQDIGIILNVTPHINSEGLVILDVSPEISSLTGTTVPISETVNASVYAKRSATSRVAIRDGQTIVIGGLMEDQKNEEVKKVPLLGDIPVIGSLFRRTTTESSKTELLIFLTPHVALQPEMLSGISKEEVEKSSVVHKAIEPGTFEKYLKDMQPAAGSVQSRQPQQ